MKNFYRPHHHVGFGIDIKYQIFGKYFTLAQKIKGASKLSQKMVSSQRNPKI